MLLLSKLHSKLTLSDAEDLIKNYPNKNGFEEQKYDRDTFLKYQEKTGALTTQFKVTFCKDNFATINGEIPLEKCSEEYFNQMKEAYEIIKSAVEPIYGKPYSSNVKFNSYAELKKANPSENMTSGRPDDRYATIMEITWKINTDYASLEVIEFYGNMSLNFYYAVKDPFN
jgi:hypothetical protein